jgi:uncharacterized sulfatase
MDRRRFLETCGVTAGAGALLNVLNWTVSAQEAVPRPNILWLLAEDFSPHLGCYGDPDAITPAIDALADDGLRYTRAYSHAPVCAPARSTLFTGMSPACLGSQQMRTVVAKPDHVRCFTEYLHDAGYYCFNGMSLGGKDHNRGVQSKDDFNFRTPSGTWDARFTPRMTDPEQIRKAHWSACTDGQPFFGLIGFVCTHQSQYGRTETPKQARHLIPLVKDNELKDRARLTIPPYHPDTPEVREIWGRYKDAATNADHQVARVIEMLKQDGLYDDTIVIFFGDHGHGIPGGKRWLWDSGLRVPLIVRVPEKYQHLLPESRVGVTDRMVSFEDFAPSMLRLGGVPIPDHMEGKPFLGAKSLPKRDLVYGIRDRIDGVYELIRSVRDERYHYMRNFFPHDGAHAEWIEWEWAPHMLRSMRELHNRGALSGRQDMFFANSRPAEELYDMTNDPDQMYNLADDPKHQSALMRLRNACFEHMKQIGDLGLLPEYECWKRAEGRTQHDIATDPRLNPVDRLLAAAVLTGQRDPANLPELVKLLDDADAGVRWWGTVGLAALGKDAEPATEALRQTLRDEAPDPRIGAAQALCTLGHEQEALPVLIKALQHESIFVRLRALNALLRIGDKARPALPHVRAARMDRTTAQIVPYHLDNTINTFLTRFGEDPLPRTK